MSLAKYFTRNDEEENGLYDKGSERGKNMISIKLILPSLECDSLFTIYLYIFQNLNRVKKGCV